MAKIANFPINLLEQVNKKITKMNEALVAVRNGFTHSGCDKGLSMVIFRRAPVERSQLFTSAAAIIMTQIT